MNYNTTETGAMRQSIGTKINTDLVPYELVVCAAVGLGLGEHKYSARNFEKGLSYKSLLASVERHQKALLDGEALDHDTQIPHYMLLASSVAMLCHNIMQQVIVEDRPEPKKCRHSIAELAEIGQAHLDLAVTHWETKNGKDIRGSE